MTYATEDLIIEFISKIKQKYDINIYYKYNNETNEYDIWHNDVDLQFYNKEFRCFTGKLLKEMFYNKSIFGFSFGYNYSNNIYQKSLDSNYNTNISINKITSNHYELFNINLDTKIKLSKSTDSEIKFIDNGIMTYKLDLSVDYYNNKEYLECA